MKKLAFISFLILIILFGFLLLSSKIQLRKTAQDTKITPSKTQLKVRLARNVFARENQILMIIASQKGFFKKYNIEPDLVITDKNISIAMASGKADVALAATYPFLLANIQGSNFQWVGTVTKTNPIVLVTYKDSKDIRSLGIISATSRVQALKILRGLKLDPKNISFEEISTNQARLAALTNKKIDAIIIEKPEWIIFKEKSKPSEEFNTLTDSIEEDLKHPGAMIVQNSFLKTKKTTVENLSKALIEANSWIHLNNEETIQMFQKEAKINEAEAKIYVENYLSTTRNLKFPPKLKEAEEILKSLEPVNPKAKDYNVKEFISSDIANSLDGSGFLKKFKAN